MQTEEHAAIDVATEHLRIIPGDLLQALGNYTPPAAPLSDSKKAELSKTIAKKRMQQAQNSGEETPATEAIREISETGIPGESGDNDDGEDFLGKEELEALERSRPAVLSLPSSAVVRAYQVRSCFQLMLLHYSSHHEIFSVLVFLFIFANAPYSL